MNLFALFFFFACATLLVFVPRRFAPAALLLGSIYMTLGQGIEFLSIRLPVYRMMLIVGLIRVSIRREKVTGSFNAIDYLVVTWGLWVILSSLFHDQEKYGLIYACGNVFNLVAIYALFRIWCVNLDDIRLIVASTALILTPIAIEMCVEKSIGRNAFSVLGGVPEQVPMRQGNLRAQGPFLHAILAGTVGATCVPLFIGLLSNHRRVAILGIVAGIVMTFTSSSSGPVISLLFGLGAIGLYQYRAHLRKIRFAFVILYLFLMVVMKQPPYYLISRIDLSGGSTGWHRSFLIEQTFKHLSEWWLFGTDTTRHWMPMQGIAHDPQHTDITNYYIGFGILGGLPSISAVMVLLIVAFMWIGKMTTVTVDVPSGNLFMIYSLGACLFSHAITSISVAYFDQSMIFFWMTVAMISSLHSSHIESKLQENQKNGTSGTSSEIVSS